MGKEWKIAVGVLAAWVIVVGGWLNMDCDTSDVARIAAYTVGLVMFSLIVFVTYGATYGRDS